MKIVVLHLSDLHISSKSAIHMENTDALVKSLTVFDPFEGIVIAFSGDIAGNGLRNEYKLADLFIGSLVKSISDTYKIKAENIKVIVAPGNHDINRQISAQCAREEVEGWYKKNELDNHIDDELNRMEDFYYFANNQKCFFLNKPIFTRKILHFLQDEGLDKFHVEINLFNSTLFSGADDNGIHFFPNSAFHQFKEPSSGQFSISIMHHSPDWFSPAQKVQLQELLYSRSNLVLYGHEHIESSQQILQNQHGNTFIQAGGAWWLKSFNDSSYYAGVFDTITRTYQQYKFVWSFAQRFYEHKEIIDTVLPYKCINGSKLIPSASYIETMLKDEKQPICGDISRYFVFPKLRAEKDGHYDGDTEIRTIDEMVGSIESTPQVMIIGSSGSGKTTLLRMLFLHLAQRYTVLLCGTEEISGKIQKNIIRDAFEDIYGTESHKMALFQQQHKKEKIILIDDVHLIKQEHLKKLLQGLGQLFEHIVIAGDKSDTFDIRERISEELELKDDIRQFVISKFYADKRRELIRNIIKVYLKESEKSVDELETRIDNAISLQSLAYKLDPDFIVKFVIYYCQHIRELKLGNLNVFSKVFEASIEVAINQHIRKETIGQIKTALGDVAHYIHFGKRYPINELEIEQVVNEYSAKYEEPLSAKRFLEVVTAANLLIRCEDSLSYKFKNKDHLAYFVAEAVSRYFNEGEPDSEANLSYIVEYSCFGINSEILKFIAYTTGNIRIIELLIHQAISYIEKWPVYNLDVAQFNYLENIPESKMKKIASNTKRKEIEAVASTEKAVDLSASDAIETLDLYDYDESDIDEINNQLIRAFVQMNIVSSCLPTFSHMMPATTKRELISTIYNMPNQIFNQWASMIDENIDSIIEEFLEDMELESEHKTQKARSKILTAMQRTSVNLLLNLYYSVALQCTTPSTIDNLANSRYVSSVNNSLERMMFYEKEDNWAEFIKEAESIYNNTESGMIKNMITAMVHHILVWSPSIPTDKQQHLLDKFRLTSRRKAIIFSNSKLTK